MNITSKYDIGDIVKFQHNVTYQGGQKKEKPEIRVGIIDKILVTTDAIKYLMQSSNQDWVDENDVISVLVDAA